MGLQSVLHGLRTKDPVAAAPAIQGATPTQTEIIQNRYQWGPNLGAMFVTERWIDNSLFTEQAQGDSELDALVSFEKAGKSLDETRDAWEKRWKEFLTDDDWKFLSDKGVTAVRLPIGFWNVGGGAFTKGTPFEKYSKVYANSWNYIKNVISAAASHNIGVLVDIHALPGGANADSHSGTSSNKAGLWSSSGFRDESIAVYEQVAKDINGIDNVVGLQIVNEAPHGEGKAQGFYLDAASKIRKINASVPIILSDGWDVNAWRSTVKEWNSQVSKPGGPATTGIVVDTHVYRMFSDDDKGKSAEEHVNNAEQSVNPDDDADTMVGEYSCVLSEESWGKSQNTNRGDLEVEYGRRENANFVRSTRTGAYFWTYKFAQGMGGAWDFRVMADKGALSPPNSQQPKTSNVDDALGPALEQHKNYWNSQDSKADWEHWRFEAGFKQGFEDAKAFWDFNQSRIGRIAALKTARLGQHVKSKGASDKTWVYSQAYSQGVDAFV